MLLCLIAAASSPAQTLIGIDDGARAEIYEGWSLARAGDLDGDGMTELVIGCPDNMGPGAIRILSLATFAPIRSYLGDAYGHQLGADVDGGFDSDGDGIPDVLGGAPRWDLGNPFDDRGRATVWSGRTGRLRYDVIGTAPSETFGSAVAWLGDVDGDGRSEFAVGGPGWNRNSGRVTVFRGVDGTPLLTLDGETAGDFFGIAVARAGDLDRDGIPDLVVGAPYHGPRKSGRIYLYALPHGRLIRAFDGHLVNEHFGQAVCVPGDLDRDGHRDVVAGAPDADADGGILSGRVTAWSGATGARLWQLDGAIPYSRTGSDLDATSDADGDGISDLVVGRPFIPP